MNGPDLTHSQVSRARLDEMFETAAPHLRPIVASVRDLGVSMLFVGQSDQAFRLPRDADRPAVILIGDDFDRADGPSGFHLPSVRRAIRNFHAFAVVSSAPPAQVYTAVAATTAITRRNCMLVETRPEQEIQWINLVQSPAPRRMTWLATVEGGHA